MRLTLPVLVAKLRIAVNNRLPDKPVRRTVQGVEMMLPRRHVLPYYAGKGSLYGRNLVEVGRLLAEAEGSLCLLDVGANVGDTALHVLDQAPGTAVCVEPDPVWLEYLRMNVDHHPNIAIEPSAIVGPDQAAPLRVVHENVGTSRLEVADDTTAGLPTITTDELLARHPQLGSVRLIKSDTDGYDVMLMPPLARTFAASRPVLFFEFDPRPTLLATPDLDPSELWGELADLGYEHAVVWDNGGRLLGGAPTRSLAGRTAELATDPRQRGYEFWDVAVAHRDDPVGAAVLHQLAGSMTG